MRATLIRIGNSRGIRIPKLLLEQCHFVDEVEIEVRADSLVVRPAGAPRRGRDAAFQSMAARGDDSLLDPSRSAASSGDETEWEW